MFILGQHLAVPRALLLAQSPLQGVSVLGHVWGSLLHAESPLETEFRGQSTAWILASVSLLSPPISDALCGRHPKAPKCLSLRRTGPPGRAVRYVRRPPSCAPPDRLGDSSVTGVGVGGLWVLFRSWCRLEASQL